MNSLQCPACKQSIDGDSLYCDQCGEQIFVCSVCGRAGKGKRCIFDGKEMITPGASGGSGSSSATEQINVPPAPQPVQPPAPPPQVTTSNKIKFTAQNLGIVIDASEGDVLGRSKGTFAAVLGRLSHISGSHCKILKTNGVWSIMDMGSTNGTFCNGIRINPNTPVNLFNGAKVKLADIEFVVSFDEDDGGTQRI